MCLFPVRHNKMRRRWINSPSSAAEPNMLHATLSSITLEVPALLRIQQADVSDRFVTSELLRNVGVGSRNPFAVSCHPAVKWVYPNAGCVPLLCAVDREKIFVSAPHIPAPDEVFNRDSSIHCLTVLNHFEVMH